MADLTSPSIHGDNQGLRFPHITHFTSEPTKRITVLLAFDVVSRSSRTSRARNASPPEQVQHKASTHAKTTALVSQKTVDLKPTQQTQNICITFVQCRTNVEDVGSTLYKCYTNVLCLLERLF